MTKIYVYKDNGCFKPVDDKAMKQIDKIENGEVCEFSVKKVRCYQHLQKWWCMCQMVAENQRNAGFDYLDTKEKIDYTARVKSGHIDMSLVINGVVVIRPKTISYEIGQDEFNEFYEKAVPVLCEISTISREDMEQNYHLYQYGQGA